MQGEPEARNIQDFIKTLNDHEKVCQQEGDYVQAELSRTRIQELKSKQ